MGVERLAALAALLLVCGCASGNRQFQLVEATGPVYPAEARSAAIEGHVVVRYDLTAAGEVHNVRIVEAVPPGVFDAAALAAVERWRYQPRYRDGVAEPVHNIESRVEFRLSGAESYAEYDP